MIVSMSQFSVRDIAHKVPKDGFVFPQAILLIVDALILHLLAKPCISRPDRLISDSKSMQKR